MSPDWHWLAVLTLALPPALGHLYHFVLIVNVGSSLGFAEPIMDRIRYMLFAALLASSGLLLYAHTRDPWWNWGWPYRGYALLCLLSATVIAPLCSLRLAFRRRPEAITGRCLASDLAGSDRHRQLIGTGRNSWLLRLPGNESFLLCRREWELTLSRMPEKLDGLQIVQLTDLHMATCFDRGFFEKVVENCLEWHADLLVVTGDLLEDDATLEWIEPLLGRLEARLGKFAILGNHDRDHHPHLIDAELSRAGFEMLDGKWISLECDGAVLALGGTSEPWGRPLDYRTMPAADLRILLSHSPDQFYVAQKSAIDFVLSGHNHGGQIRLRLLGPIFMPSRYSRRFDRGFFQCGQTLMYVSEGVAGKHPYRFGCPPEIAKFDLKIAQAPRSQSVLQGGWIQGRKGETIDRDCARD
jgi:predicted MPP superfamily phosphohydrolase